MYAHEVRVTGSHWEQVIAQRRHDDCKHGTIGDTSAPEQRSSLSLLLLTPDSWFVELLHSALAHMAHSTIGGSHTQWTNELELI